MELESVKRIYDGYSSVYDALFKRFFYPRIRHAIQSMDIRPGERVLDVGVGTGLSLSFFPRHATIVGIDLSGEMLRKAKEKVEEMGLYNVRLLEMNAMNLNFEDNSFDEVFLSHVVSVVPDPYMVMAECRRVCKNGGKIVVVNHFKSRNKMIAGFEKIMNPVSKKIGWRSDLSMDEFVERASLRVEKVCKLKKIDFWHIIFTTNVK
ncbi:MAG: methyltransferase domain-containing protein [Deltaproteobacteria bacterium]|nr:methyltransferase domain-containing protein [Deltaproteobacteria bacterium]